MRVLVSTRTAGGEEFGAARRSKSRLRPVGARFDPCWLVAALLVLAATAPSFGQLSSAGITALQERGRAEGWTFTVRESTATMRAMDELCGLVMPKDWQANARFYTPAATRSLPESFDWRDLNGCTPVRDQGGCGSCWAFATVGPLESNILIKDGLSVDLSEQWLVSCNRSGWDCGGGWWAHGYHAGEEDPCGGTGAVYEADFPYVAADVPCGCPYPHEYLIEGWNYCGTSSYVIKQVIMDYGPVTVGIHVNDAFHAYGGGVFNGCANGEINHGVVLVGWDDNEGTNGVWYLRNSWGPSWGESGYMRIEYDCSLVGYGASFIDYRGMPLEAPAAASYPHHIPKNRYVSFAPKNPLRIVALQVEMTAGPGAPAVLGWVGEPQEPSPTEYVARVVNTPVYRLWTEPMIHIADCEIVPAATYEIRATWDGIEFGLPLEVSTVDKPGDKFWGDVVGLCFGGFEWTAPNGYVNVDDVQAWLDYVRLSPVAPHITVLDLDGEAPNWVINVTDVQMILQGFQAKPYPPISFPTQGTPADCP